MRLVIHSSQILNIWHWGGYNCSSALALVVYPGGAGVEEGAGVEDILLSFTLAPYLG